MKILTTLQGFIVIASALGLIWSSDLFAQKAEKKKLYISSVKNGKNVTQSEADKIRNQLTLAIFEKFGSQYSVITDEDIAIMFQQAELIQALGCDSDKCSIDIGKAIYADEIIFGTVNKEGDKYSVFLKNIEIRNKPNISSTKSIVKLNFSDTQIEGYCREIGIKLVNPAYVIDIAKIPVFSEKIDSSTITLVPVKGTSISEIVFKTNDDTIDRYIDIFKAQLDDADKNYQNGDFQEARSNYKKIIDLIESRISSESIGKMSNYIEGLNVRIDATYLMEYKLKIEKVDAYFKNLTAASERDYRKTILMYHAIDKEVSSVSEFRIKAMGEIRKAINDRMEQLIIAIVETNESRGDIAYKEYRFVDALGEYYKAGKNASSLGSFSETRNRVNSKIKIVFATGDAYIENIVNSGISQAEYYNLTGDKVNSLKSTKKARDTITGPLKIFASYNIIDRYNLFADKVSGAIKIAPEKDSDTYNAMNNPPEYLASEKSKNKGYYHNPYTYTTIGISVITVGSFIGGVYFNSRAQTNTNTYNDLAAEYKANYFNPLALPSIQSKMNSEQKSYNQNTNWRNALYVTSIVGAGFLTWSMYKLFTYGDVNDDIPDLQAHSITVLPLVAYTGSTTYNQPFRNALLYSCSVVYRF